MLSEPVGTGRATSAGASGALIEAAVVIGERLVGRAVWWRDLCNWTSIGWDHEGDVPIPTCWSLGADIYGGTAGVGVFLAEVAAITGCRRTRATAIAALATALEPDARLSPENRFGFHAGISGVAWAAQHVGRVAEASGLAERAARLMDELGEPDDVPEFDLVSGLAGAIAGILALPEDARAMRVDRAVGYGDRLLSIRTNEPSGWSWRSPDRDGISTPARNLTGLSHGAAGVAFALQELHSVTGLARFREAAARAREYEDSVFDVREANWPDFRGGGAAAHPTRRRSPVAWCHGAPGILLSRLRNAHLGASDVNKGVVASALDTVRTFIADARARGVSDWSLCHGLLGISELALLPGAFEPAYVDDLLGFIAVEATTRTAPDETWECGTTEGIETPGVMAGLAGIGLQLLRLARRDAVPSVILPVRHAPSRN